MIDRLRFPPQPGERSPAQLPEHAGVRPFAVDAAWAKVAFDERAVGRQPAKRRIGDRGVEGVTIGEVGRREWPVSPRVPSCEVAHRISSRRQKGFWNSAGQFYAQRVPIAGRVLDGDVSLGFLTRDAN